MIKILWAFFLLLISFWFSWSILAKQNFFYTTIYEKIDMNSHIKLYAPKNWYKKGFENTTKEQRIDFFQKIVFAILNDAEGLETLKYSNGNKTVSVLRDAEIIHLKDVANLVNFLEKCFYFCLFLFILISYLFYKKKINFPSIKETILLVLFVLLLFFVFVYFYGAENIFNQLHIWIFPQEHQWYFFYEESLMTTLMKAPDIFAYILGMIFVLGLVIFICIVRLFREFKIVPDTY